MTHDYPLLQVSAPPLAAKVKSPVAAPPPAAIGAWRYPMPRRSRLAVTLAVVISASFHGGLFINFHSRSKAAAPPAEKTIALNFVMPNLKDLEEPEPLPPDPTADKIDPGEYAPTLMDAPQIALPTAFVQEINFASLIPQPDLNQAKVFVIPGNIMRTGKLGEGFGNIFNLADLDHVPEPTVQPSPIFPQALKREVTYARVVLEFIVDVEGRVVNPVVVQSTFPGFEEAAVNGVSRWRFRPGMKAGKRVNTRMSVPIIFRLTEAEG